jgi:biotin transport system ATP-binding protein
MTLLETQNLTHIFPDGTIGIRDINLSIQVGEFVILSGTNGSGKTVLTRHFNGLLLPTKGKVLFEGKPITDNLTYTRKSIGLIFQDSNHQIVGQTVAEDVAFGPENLGLPPVEVKQRVQDALASVELSHLAHQRPYVLSGGQKRKLAIAGVLAMKPKMIILDEPFTGLDYPGILQVLQQILALHQKGHAIILITHELEKVLAHANRLIIMEQGKVVRDGHPGQIIAEVGRYGLKIPYGENRKVETMTWLR